MNELFAAFGLNWKLLLTQAFNFGLLLVVLTYFLYKPVLKMIDERRETIAKGVKDAESAAKKLEAAKNEGAKIVGDASREGEAIVASARTRAEERGAEILQSAEAQAQATLQDARARAEEAKRQALKESEKEITRAAMLAAEKILKEKK